MTNSNRRWVAVALAAAVVGVVSAHVDGQTPGPQSPPPAVGTGLIIGQVVDVDTGRGIPHAPVALVGVPTPGAAGRAAGPVRPMGVLADSQGRFVFGGLPAGAYMPQSELPEYLSMASARTITLGDGDSVTDLKVALRRLSRLSGRVVDDTGSPVVGVEVVALRRLAAQGRPISLSPAARTRTDDRGEYRLGSLIPDDYLVCACGRDPLPFDDHLLTTLAGRPLDLVAVAGRAATAGADAAGLETSLRTFPVTLHPSATLVSLADRVRLSPGDSRTGVDVTLAAVPARRVSGRLLGVTTAVSAQMLRLRAVGDVPEAAALTQIVPMLVQPDGRFDFANVPPGQYVLDVTFRPGLRGAGPSGAALALIGARGQQMTPPPPPPQRVGGPMDPSLDPLWARELITVGDRDVTGLTITLNRSLVVTGRVVFSGAAPQPTPQLLQRPIIQMLSLELGSQLRSYNSGIQADGSFELRGVVPGRYALQPSLVLPGWPTLRSVVGPDGDLTDTLLDLSSDLTGVTITITDTPATSVDVRLQPPPRDDTEGVWVRVFPSDRRFWQAPFGATRRFITRRLPPSGTTTIGGLPAGEYVVATSPDTNGDWMTLESLDALARQGERFRLADAEKLVVEVRR